MKNFASPMSRKTVRFRVTGRVQGVGYRAFVFEKAREWGVRGWVANCRDGSVGGVAEIGEETLSLWREALLSGPPGARVEKLEIEEAGERDLLSEGRPEFRIERECP
ncbi:MAG: acylphosphatase [Leptospirales bacterium]